MTSNPLGQGDLVASLIASRTEYKAAEIETFDALAKVKNLQSNERYENGISEGVKLKIGIGLITQERQIQNILSARKEAYETTVRHFAQLYKEPPPQEPNIEVLERKLYNYASKLQKPVNQELSRKIELLFEKNLALTSDLIEVKQPLELYEKSLQARFTAPEINILDEIMQECRKDPMAYKRFATDPKELSFERIPASFK